MRRHSHVAQLYMKCMAVMNTIPYISYNYNTRVWEENVCRAEMSQSSEVLQDSIELRIIQTVSRHMSLVSVTIQKCTSCVLPSSSSLVVCVALYVHIQYLYLDMTYFDLHIWFQTIYTDMILMYSILLCRVLVGPGPRWQRTGQKRTKSIALRGLQWRMNKEMNMNEMCVIVSCVDKILLFTQYYQLYHWD